MEYVKAARVSDIPDPGKQVLEIDDRFVVLLHVGGEFFCIDDRCTHDDGPLGEGDLCDHQIACPRHGAKFDVRDGRAVTMPATETTTVHEVKVDGGDVYVKINEG
ncbi:MAG: non-heme iron oxygenase ferredoxin subunit [Pirellulaceae bacterium]